MYKNETEILKIDTISDPMVSFSAKIERKIYAILGVYSPTKARSNINEKEEKEFIEQLQTTIDKQPKKHTLILHINFNSKLGSFVGDLRTHERLGTNHD